MVLVLEVISKIVKRYNLNKFSIQNEKKPAELVIAFYHLQLLDSLIKMVIDFAHEYVCATYCK